MFGTIADALKMIGYCGSGLGALCGGYIWLGGPIPTTEHRTKELLQAEVVALRGELTPLKIAQNTQAKSLDRFLLFQQQELLEKAKADPAASTSPTVQRRIRELEQQIQDTERRITKGDPRKPPED